MTKQDNDNRDLIPLRTLKQGQWFRDASDTFTGIMLENWFPSQSDFVSFIAFDDAQPTTAHVSWGNINKPPGHALTTRADDPNLQVRRCLPCRVVLIPPPAGPDIDIEEDGTVAVTVPSYGASQTVRICPEVIQGWAERIEQLEEQD